MYARVALWMLGLVASGPSALAAPPFSSVSVSPDVTVELSGTTFHDEDVAVDNLLGVVVPESLGNLPANVGVSAYHLLQNGDRLFSLDTSVELAGPLTPERGDVVRYDGISYALEFDGSAAGIPEGTAVDAVSQTSGGDLWLSLDTTADLGGGVVAADEDLVQWDGSGFTLVFDGSAQGIAEGLDLDGAHDVGDGTIGISFDGSGSVGSVAFDDEDVLLFDPSGPAWEIIYDGSAQHPELAAADVEAVALPEPAFGFSLVSGLALLVLLSRVRPSRV